MDNAFYKFPAMRQLVMDQLQNKCELNVCSLGGGPGSELLGFVKFIERERRDGDRIDINFTLIDQISEWDETWQAMIKGLQETFESNYGSNRREWPIVVHRSFLPLNLTQLHGFQNFPSRFNGVQIYVLNYTVSELLAHKVEFKKVFRHIVQYACDGAFFLFIDRNQDEVVKLINELVTISELALLANEFEKTNMDLDEEKLDLGEWYQLMGRNPKLKWNAFFALAQKKV